MPLYSQKQNEVVQCHFLYMQESDESDVNYFFGNQECFKSLYKVVSLRILDINADQTAIYNCISRFAFTELLETNQGPNIIVSLMGNLTESAYSRHHFHTPSCFLANRMVECLCKEVFRVDKAQLLEWNCRPCSGIGLYKLFKPPVTNPHWYGLENARLGKLTAPWKCLQE